MIIHSFCPLGFSKTLLFLRVLANMLVLIVLASSTYAINLVVTRSQEVEKRLQVGEDVGWWDQNEVSIFFEFLNSNIHPLPIFRQQ